jgi:hypothetical protein
MAQVTDEMVEKAWKTYHAQGWGMGTYDKMRAALESVADDLRAEGMREAAVICDNAHADWEEPLAIDLSKAILARANQLSPATQKETA